MIAHGRFGYRAPVLKDSFINPRENNQVVNDIDDENIMSFDLAYIFQLPHFSGRFTTYYTRFQNLSKINYFYVNSGVGSDFVQQLLGGMDRLHRGIEFGISISPSSALAITAVASVSKYSYLNNPKLEINF